PRTRPPRRRPPLPGPWPPSAISGRSPIAPWRLRHRVLSSDQAAWGDRRRRRRTPGGTGRGESGAGSRPPFGRVSPRSPFSGGFGPRESSIMSELMLVTGAGGFIGGHLVRDLLERGHRVRAVDKKPLDEWYQVFPDAENVVADLND